MKKRSYIKIAFLSLASMALLSSCLKDDSHYVDFAGAKPLVELPSATGIGPQGGYFQAAAFDISATPQVLNLAVNLAAPKPLSSALTVKLSVDEAALNAYNTANGTTYVLLPAADYTSTLTAVIPANKNLSNFVINVNTSLMDPAQSYVLPLTITDGGGQQISNYKTVLLNIQVKNQYDGNYHAVGVRHHPTLGDFPFDYNVDMSTAGATSITGGALADLKSDLKVTINSDNSISISSVSQSTVAFQLGTVNKYDPATKTITLHYFYNTSAPRLIDETLTKN